MWVFGPRSDQIFLLTTHAYSMRFDPGFAGHMADPRRLSLYSTPSNRARASRASGQSGIGTGAAIADKVYEFLFVWSPLKMKGATGSPGNPVALY